METQNAFLTIPIKLAIVLTLPSAAWAVSTADYYHCSGRVGGEWNYGRAPSGCNASSFGDDKVLLENFAPAIFDDSSSRTLERERYMQEVYTIVRDAANYYMKTRKPGVSPTELQWWTLAIMATASHESYASQYRKASDGRLKMMRGDLGHGHGLMQIDDRGHFPAITNGTAWNLITNLTYGMDIFYEAWERAPSKSCVGSATKYEARARAAWAAYNGGPSQLCRWTNNRSAWAANDSNFFNALSNRTWLSFVRAPSAVASINVACLIEKKENCPKTSGPADPGGPSPGTPDPSGPGLPAVVEGQLYQLPSGAYCSRLANDLHCVAEFRDALCLRAVTPLSTNLAQTLSGAQAAPFAQVAEDRHALCTQFDNTLYKVGALLEVEKNILVRDSPGGGKLGVVLIGDTVEVLDFELRSYPTIDRYYKIRIGSLTGFIYAGTKADAASWLKVSSGTQKGPSNVAQVGDRIQIISAIGINLRKTPSGALQLRVPVGIKLVVSDRVVNGSDNGVYYKVTYGSQTGYIYSGRLLPTDTTAQWTTRLREI